MEGIPSPPLLTRPSRAGDARSGARNARRGYAARQGNPQCSLPCDLTGASVRRWSRRGSRRGRTPGSAPTKRPARSEWSLPDATPSRRRPTPIRRPHCSSLTSVHLTSLRGQSKGPSAHPHRNRTPEASATSPASYSFLSATLPPMRAPCQGHVSHFATPAGYTILTGT
jgi:hypothetical protein